MVDDSAKLTTTLPQVLEFPYLVQDGEVYFLQAESLDRSLGHVGDTGSRSAETSKIQERLRVGRSWRPSRLLASKPSRLLTAPFGIASRFTAIPITGGTFNADS